MVSSSKSKIYFIADLHLSSSHHHLLKLFHYFIKNILKGNDKLYILGDLFEYSIGEDSTDLVAQEVKELLKKLRERNIHWYFLAGNRDFLWRRKSIQALGGQLLKEKTVIKLDHQKILLLHGDTLCTLDESYQLLRKKLNQRWLQNIFLFLPLFLRKKIAEKLRTKSSMDIKQKSVEDMDAVETEILKDLNKYDAKIMIHGHVHRPGVHIYSFTDPNKKKVRYVLSDWDKYGNYLCYTQEEFTLSYFDLPQNLD